MIKVIFSTLLLISSHVSATMFSGGGTGGVKVFHCGAPNFSSDAGDVETGQITIPGGVIGPNGVVEVFAKLSTNGTSNSGNTVVRIALNNDVGGANEIVDTSSCLNGAGATACEMRFTLYAPNSEAALQGLRQADLNGVLAEHKWDTGFDDTVYTVDHSVDMTIDINTNVALDATDVAGVESCHAKVYLR